MLGDMGDISEQSVTDGKVRRHVAEMRLQSPNMGESMAIGRFRALGIRLHVTKFVGQLGRLTHSTLGYDDLVD